MLDSIYIGMSGLTAHSKGLQTISNNVANLNTPGFKTTTPRFSDLYYGQRFFGEGPDSARISSAGSGVDYSYSSLNFKQGETRNSDGPLDLAIDGSGFLALLDGDQVRYARTGQFAIADDGTLKERTSELRLALLGADGRLSPIALDRQRISPPKATSRIAFTDNLSTGQETFSIPNVEVYDASGAKHALAIKFARDKTAPPPGQRWTVKLENKDAQTVGEGEIQFIAGIPEPGMDQFDFSFKPAAAEASTITLDFKAITSFSQGTTSTLKADEIDGYPLGSLSAFKIDDQGRLVASYSNGQTAELGSVALADFADPQRLVQLGNGLFDASRLPPPSYVTSKDGAGELISGSLESSNVDLSAEFGRLILIQRGFQASSQVISTANEMILQLFQIKGAQG